MNTTKRSAGRSGKFGGIAERYTAQTAIGTEIEIGGIGSGVVTRAFYLTYPGDAQGTSTDLPARLSLLVAHTISSMFSGRGEDLIRAECYKDYQ